MFSVEKTLEEILQFTKKFFRTFMTILFKPATLQAENTTILQPTLFLLLALVLSFGFIQLNIRFIDFSFDTLLRRYVTFLEDNVNGISLLSVIMIGGMLYLATIAIARLLFTKPVMRSNFKNLVFYPVATGLILVTIFQFITIWILITVDIVPEKFMRSFNIWLRIFSTVPFLIATMLPLFAILFSGSRRLWYEAIRLTVAVILTPLFIYFATRTMGFILPFVKPPESDLCELRNLSGRFEMQIKSTTINDSTLRLSSEMLVENNGADVLYLTKGEPVYLKAVNDAAEDPVEWGNKHQLSLTVTEIDRNMSSDFKPLKKGEFASLIFSSTLQPSDWKNFLDSTKKEGQDQYVVTANFFPHSRGGDASFVREMRLATRWELEAGK